MRSPLLSLLVSAAVAASVGCGDDTGTGGGNGGSPSDGGGGNGTGAAPSNGGGGEGAGGDNTGGAGAMGPGFTCEAAAADPGAISLTPVASLGQIVDIQAAPGAPDRLFVVQQNGVIRIVDDGTLVETPFLNVSGIIRSGGEEGLLGLAFHPDYEENGRFFIHYSASGNGDSTVFEYEVSDDPLVASTTPVQLVVRHPTAQGNHNGGALDFSEDGYLFVSLGDGGSQCDPGCDALSLDTLLGKILRLDVDATPDEDGYPAASGNPDGEKYYHIGFRNPWRMSVDSCTGDLYIGDVGQNSWEEIDLAQQDDGPLNFGWPIREGAHAQPDLGNQGGCGYDDSCPASDDTLVDPIAEYAHPAGGPGSVTGGYVYRGSDSPSLRGWYFYADYNLGRLYMLRAVDGEVVDEPVLVDIDPGVPTAFGIDGNGEVYLGDYSGTLYKIVAN